MKSKLPWIVVGILTLWLVAGLRPAKENSEFNITKFSETPILLNGRIKPIDTMARTTLLMISGKQKVVLEGNGANGQWGEFLELKEDPRATPLSGRNWYQFSKHPKKLSAMEWLMEVTMKPEIANDRYIFRMSHPELIVDLGLEEKGYEKAGFHWFTFNELRETPGLFEALQSERDRLEENQIKPEQYSPTEKQMVKLYSSLQLYNRLKNSFRPETSGDFSAELDAYFSLIPEGMEAARNREAGREFNEEAFEILMSFIGTSGYDTVASIAYPLIIPPSDPSVSRDAWTNIGDELLSTLRTESLPDTVRDYAELASAYRQNRPEDFNASVDRLQKRLSASYSEELGKGEMETAYNHYNPFLKSQVLYIIATLFALVFWLKLDEKYRKTALYIMLVALVVHSAGIITRMVLEGRPPVTNLYSSAIFVGWGSVFLCILLENIFKNGIGIVVASMVGFITLLIGHYLYLSLARDQLEMMQAVLDTNAWLATHVVIITLGYSATFVAGFIAIIYVIRGVFTKTLTRELGKSLAKMVYGIVCFATLLSFVGTILGGIWADQSWGRFWGWDPKENGALIIVIWNAAILHARWGGMIRDRGLMLMAIFGNIATAFSWFGVNLLGIGLHTYGFMEGSFEWMTYFTISQVALLIIGGLPLRLWASFRTGADTPPSPGLPKEASA